jgi:dipeptidase D
MSVMLAVKYGVLMCLLFGAGAAADTGRILDIFADISRVPRCSRSEERISAWIVDWARQRGLQAKTDGQRNVLVVVPASKGYENRATVILQAHMDMVCQKTAGSPHDFATDPITLVRDADWLRARDTTLGADDGIGVALALALAEDAAVRHPRLELLFTTNEEADMTGAAGLSSDFLTGKKLVNIDSEIEGTVVLGSAGGLKSDIMLPLTFSPLTGNESVFTLRVDGLLGGHSGLEIDKDRASANVLLARALSGQSRVRLIDYAGGTAANVIPRRAEANLAVSPDQVDRLRAQLAAAEREIRARYPEERNVAIALTRYESGSSRAASEADSAKVVRLLLAIPYGVQVWSEEFAGLPETSNNIGIVRTENETLYVTTYQRSSDRQQLEKITRSIEAAAQSAGASSSRRGPSPPWPPKADSTLYKQSLATYQRLFGTPPKTKVVHAGLECGYIAQKYPGMEIVSIGPTLENAHTTDERLYVPSIGRVWRFMTELLRDA